MANPLLKNYPIAYAFIAHAAVILKGETIEFWEEELRDYRIDDKCECNRCHTLYLTPPDDEGGAFARGYMSAAFRNGTKKSNGIMIILHENEIGHLTQLEIPSLCDVPFKQEYNTLFDDDYYIDIDSNEARWIVAEWFKSHPEESTFAIIIDD
jgi:hypothetical protein